MVHFGCYVTRRYSVVAPLLWAYPQRCSGGSSEEEIQNERKRMVFSLLMAGVWWTWACAKYQYCVGGQGRRLARTGRRFGNHGDARSARVTGPCCLVGT